MTVINSRENYATLVTEFLNTLTKTKALKRTDNAHFLLTLNLQKNSEILMPKTLEKKEQIKKNTHNVPMKLLDFRGDQIRTLNQF